ncbi:uncharacterized protein LOC124258389 isoform X2 [Haliotis rubra]|uniref:uncharacterized protein LOC124258389 isoform X2 n=1 Tax=Haliotis rubra TaxID=36100 RepID=UPI001EE6202D|nr:uncharacterized protein LOC124258389 isoform X2 [Haliotis rubra]
MRYFLVLVACLLAWSLVRADDERSEIAEKAGNRLKRGAGYTTAAYSTTPYPYKPSATGYTKVAYSTTPYPQKSSTTKKKSRFPWNRGKRQAWYTTAAYSTTPYPYKPSATGYTKVAYSTTPYPQKSSTNKKKSWFALGRGKRQAWYTTAAYSTTPYPYKPSATDYTASYQYMTTKYPDYQTAGYSGSSGQAGTMNQLVNQGQILLQEAQGALTDAQAAAGYVRQLEETLL